MEVKVVTKRSSYYLIIILCPDFGVAGNRFIRGIFIAGNNFSDDHLRIWNIKVY